MSIPKIPFVALHAVGEMASHHLPPGAMCGAAAASRYLPAGASRSGLNCHRITIRARPHETPRSDAQFSISLPGVSHTFTRLG